MLSDIVSAPFRIPDARLASAVSRHKMSTPHEAVLLVHDAKKLGVVASDTQAEGVAYGAQKANPWHVCYSLVRSG